MKSKVKYPIGTKWYNPKPSVARVWYWEIKKQIGDEYMMRACWMDERDAYTYKRTPNSLIAAGWRIEYPKESLFDKLYLTLKS